jgi:hypothetical protein
MHFKKKLVLHVLQTTDLLSSSLKRCIKQQPRAATNLNNEAFFMNGKKAFDVIVGIQRWSDEVVLASKIGSHWPIEETKISRGNSASYAKDKWRTSSRGPVFSKS